MSFVSSEPTKYIPLSEEEYREFKEYKYGQAKRIQASIDKPPIMAPLSHAEDQKIHTLFDPTSNPELQEKRFNDLWHSIADMRKKLTSNSLKTTPQSTSDPKRDNLGNPSNETFNPSLLRGRNAQTRAERLLETLGPTAWNQSGELIVNEKPIPGSNVNELMKYSITDWRTKYSENPPKGALELRKLMKEANLKEDILGARVRAQMGSDSSSLESGGFAVKTNTPTPKRQKPKKRAAEQRGFDIVSNKKRFDAAMKK
jgi:hypothetical protein